MTRRAIGFQQEQLAVAKLHKSSIPGAMAAALGVCKNVLLRIVDFLFEFYILGCQTLSAAQLKEETGFRGQSVLNLRAARR